MDVQNPDEWGNPHVSRLLQSAPILGTQSMEEYLKSIGSTSSFTSSVHVLTLPNNVKAVFKPLEKGRSEEAVAEVTAYGASCKAGFPYVPPTVLRDVDGQKGSLQLLVENIELTNTDQAFIEALTKVNPRDLAKLRVFSFVMGQWDVRRYNFLIKRHRENYYIIAIDNSNLFQRQRGPYGELPFVLIGPSPTEDLPLFPMLSFAASQILPSPLSMEIFKTTLPEKIFARYQYYLEWVVEVEKSPCLKYCVVGDQFWRQYYFSPGLFLKRDDVQASNGELIVSAYTSLYSPEILSFLKSLSYEELRRLFNDVPYEKKLSLTIEAYCRDVLARRDLVMKDIETHQT